MADLRDYKDRDCFIDNDGNRWQIFYSGYATANGGYDEVIQLQKNGREVGHTTYHYNRKGGQLLSRNDHGNVNLPRQYRRC